MNRSLLDDSIERTQTRETANIDAVSLDYHVFWGIKSLRELASTYTKHSLNRRKTCLKAGASSTLPLLEKSNLSIHLTGLRFYYNLEKLRILLFTETIATCLWSTQRVSSYIGDYLLSPDKRPLNRGTLQRHRMYQEENWLPSFFSHFCWSLESFLCITQE